MFTRMGGLPSPEMTAPVAAAWALPPGARPMPVTERPAQRSSPLSSRGSVRMPAMPVTALLIGVRDSQDHRLIERVPDKLQADGQPVLVGAARQ
jgi:hypothetical protein